MNKEAFEQGRITHAGQDDNREFITPLSCICADATYLPPSLIYKGESGTIQDTWLEDFKEKDSAYISTSPNGWSCNELRANWLINVFNRHTKEKAKNQRRLLIVDGHSSHLNMNFINLCDQRRTLLLVLPPHSTHRLQPLDIACFAPLARYYTNELNQLIGGNLGYNDMSKRLFWKIFSPAWNKVFSSQNIASAWTKTGLFPPIVGFRQPWRSAQSLRTRKQSAREVSCRHPILYLESCNLTQQYHSYYCLSDVTTQ
jgi:hypothetical protein